MSGYPMRVLAGVIAALAALAISISAASACCGGCGWGCGCGCGYRVFVPPPPPPPPPTCGVCGYYGYAPAQPTYRVNQGPVFAVPAPSVAEPVPDYVYPGRYRYHRHWGVWARAHHGMKHPVVHSGSPKHGH
jgi:hypothetical protein